jgi:hypothetical protein
MANRFWDGVWLVTIAACGIAFLLVRLIGRHEREVARDREEGMDLLRWWAGTEGWTVIRAEFSPQGPWRWAGSNQPVFRFSVRDDEGQTRGGWARCGSWLSGLRSRKVVVRWDQPSGKPPKEKAKQSGERLWDRDLDP